MNSDANIAVHLSSGLNISGQQNLNLNGFVEFFLAVSGGSRMTC